MIDIESLPTIFEVDDITAITLDSRKTREEELNNLWNLDDKNKWRRCCLWGTQASRTFYQEKTNPNETYTEFYSPRAGGWYIAIANFADVHSKSDVDFIEIPDETGKNYIKIGRPKLALITTWLVKKRNETGCIPVLNYKSIDEAINLEKKLSFEKMLSLLQFFSKKITVGSSLKLYDEVSNWDDYAGGGGKMFFNFISLEVNFAAAESEIENYKELSEALNFFERKKYIKYDSKYRVEREDSSDNLPPKFRNVMDYNITWKIDGQLKAESNSSDFSRGISPKRTLPPQKIARNVSKQAFIALWFNKRMMDPFYEALAEGIKKAGYIPYRVDEDPFVEKIDEDLMRKIEESCFIVADFSQGKEGNRGSVYFEAGFAIGKGKNHVFTCREGTKLPFDTRNRSHIFWDYDKLDELIEEVRKRICDGRIGRGPVPYTPDPRPTFNVVPAPQED